MTATMGTPTAVFVRSPRIGRLADLDLGAFQWLIRIGGLPVVALLAFFRPPEAAGVASAQTICVVAVCLGTVAWAFVDLRLRGSRHYNAALATCLAFVAAPSAISATIGHGGAALLGYTVVAMIAAADTLSVTAILTVSALTLLAIEAGSVFYGESFGNTVGQPLLCVVGLLIGSNRASYRHRAEQASLLLTQHELLRAEQRRAGMLDERTRIAREIHDVLAHSLGALGIQVQTAKAVITDLGDGERAVEMLTTAQRMVADGLAETRRAVQALRADTLPLPEELAHAAAEHAERYGTVVRCDIEAGDLDGVSPEGVVALQRVAGEALVNAAKHAPGADIDVRFVHLPGAVELTIGNVVCDDTVRDDAVCVDAALPPHDPTPRLHTADAGCGITGMRERLSLLHGTLSAGPVDGRWVVRATVPTASSATPLSPQPEELPR
jgi:signal transduction histidine kinase